ncbi:diaminobutyrate acetyltransferase [Arthrobacter halodurans]|uniref:L-2,4-diaminobutyric acid acetyltransferase n=1 Tax=Arthrobacter halodurans TaxID=516699 RepID=A0ABV4UJ34_9MICC
MVEALENTLSEPTFHHPETSDGAALWRLARDTRVLDLNSSYSYLLWCRDFADTSLVARIDGDVAGFVTGYIRPAEPGTLMVWQVGVDAAHRGRGLAAAMLDDLAHRAAADRVETTITADNPASQRLFTRFAERHGAGCERRPLFTRDLYPDDHDTEYLYRIGPLGLDADLRSLQLAGASAGG